MKKIIIMLLAGAAMLASCSQEKGYVIYGTVSNPELEGAQVFLVPLENPVKETIDSVVIRNQMFEFRGTEEKMADIRIERYKRYGNENLLVVTEPGETFVTIGQVSSGRGTPQNDSLQVWKNLTMQYFQQSGDLRKQGMKAEADALREAYVARTRQMASNVGKGTTLGVFLDSRYPKSPDKE
ncbi:MAG: DUF4369 domain-containing protein [Bacteroidales bacterium]|nr:DUF4369 domain-containing protein [Bacteroidales bacterium]